MACNCKLREKIKNLRVLYNPKRTVYLDYNATSPVDPRVLGQMDAYIRQFWANPSSLHHCGQHVDQQLGQLRTDLIRGLQCYDGDLLFCSSGSEAIYSAIYGVMARDQKRTLITTGIEHSTLKHPMRLLQKSGRQIFKVPVDDNGTIELESLQKLLKDHPPSLFAYSPVNHETGSLQPVQEIYKLCKEYGAFVLIDAVQALVRMSTADWVHYADLFCFSGHKCYAPKGIAALWIKNGVRLRPLRFGGFQEKGIFPGTQNVPGIAALAKAVELLQEEMKDELKRLDVLKRDALALFQKASFQFVLNTPDNAASGIMNISLPWVEDMEALIMYLAQNEICISRFSACTPKLTGRSAVLDAMGKKAHISSTSLRISFGRFSKRDDFFRLVKALEQYSTKK